MSVGIQNFNSSGTLLFDSSVDTTLFHYDEQTLAIANTTLDYSIVGDRFPVPFITLSSDAISGNYSSWGYKTMNVDWVAANQIELTVQSSTNTMLVTPVAVPHIDCNILTL